MKKIISKIKTLLLALLLIILLIGGFLLLFQNLVVESNLYCDGEICYSYNGSTLKEYQKISSKKENKNNQYVLVESCRKCQAKVVEHNENKLLVKEDNIIYHYYKKGYSSQTMNPQSIVGYAFKNKYNEIYFFDSNTIIISNEKGKQKKYNYELKTYGDEYYSIVVFNRISYTYNARTKQIIGYTRIGKDEMEQISLDYYENDGSIKEIEKYQISGIFQLIGEYIEEELYIYQNKILLANANGITREEFQVLDANDTEIYFGLESGMEYYYDREEKQLYQVKDFRRYTEIDKKSLQYINLDFYNEDTTLKPFTINMDGAYRYIEENAEKEIYIKDGNIVISEYYIRSPELTKEKKYKYTPYTRIGSKITYIYEIEGITKEEFTYDTKTKNITIYYDEYKKIKESDLKHIKQKRYSN